ncbi:MAG TPA: DUF2273 domain-containing protein [Clostridiaceae bacterium]|nr:DUF2273 domain-containing protein [Clostridiaceae bacterium]
MNLESITQFYKSHRGGINGALTGLVIAVAILLFGFFRILFVAICVGIGYYVGKKLSEDKDYIKNLLDRILPPGTYR